MFRSSTSKWGYAVDIHHIRYFLAVCETLNFTRAAELCNVTQPALSRAVQQLEEEVGGLLFRRERNLTHLTDLGLLMKPRFQQIIDGVVDVRREAKRFLTLEKADLSLGVMCTIGPVRFTGILGHFQAQFPGITLNLIEGTPPQLVQRIENGEVDVAIMAQSEGFPERFDLLPLFRERFLVALPAGHRLASKSSVRMAELDGENYLERLNCEYHNHISNVLQSSSCNVSIVYESDREDWIQNMVAGGLGVTIVPEFSAVIPGIAALPLVEPEIWRTVNLVTMSGRRHSPAVASMVKSLKQYHWPESRFAGDQAVA